MKRKAFWRKYRFYCLRPNGKRKPPDRPVRLLSPRNFAERVGYTGYISRTEDASKVPDKVTIEIETLRFIEQALSLLWRNVWHDYDPMTNRKAIQTCLDSALLECHLGMPGQRAYEMVVNAMERFDYDDVLDFLTRHVNLVKEVRWNE